MTIETYEDFAFPLTPKDLMSVTEDGLCDLIEEHQKHNTLKLLDIRKVNEQDVGIRPLLCLSKLDNLTELRIDVRIFNGAALTMLFQEHPLVSGNNISSSLSVLCVKRIHVLVSNINPEEFGVLEEFCKCAPEIFPSLSELSYEDSSHGAKSIKYIANLKAKGTVLMKLMTQLVVDSVGMDELGVMTNLKQVRFLNLGWLYSGFPNNLVNLKRLILEKEVFELNFSVVIDILDHCVSLTELYVCCRHISHASDAELASVFQRSPNLKNLEVFYISSMERNVSLTEKSLDLILRHCSKTLRRLGQLQTWELPPNWELKPGKYSGSSFATISAHPLNRNFCWAIGEGEKTELDNIPKFFYD